MADLKIVIGAEIKELEQKLAVAKAKLAEFGQQGPRALVPLQQRLSGLTFPTKGLDNFTGKFKTLGGVLKSSGALASLAIAGIGLAVAGATKVFEIIKKDFVSVGNAAAETAKKIKDYKDIVDSAVTSTAKEATEVLGLLAVLNNETETRGRKLAAIKELQKIQPEIFKGLKLEGEAVVGLDEAYKAYLVNLKSVIAAKIIQAQIEAKVTELLKIQGAANTKEQQAQLDNLKNLINTSEALSAVKKGLQDTKIAGGFLTDKQTAARVAGLNNEIKGLFEKLTEFSQTIKVKEIKVKPDKITVEKPDKLPNLGSVSLLNQLITDEVPLSGITLTPKVIVSPKIDFKVDPEQEKKVFDGLKALLDAEKLQNLSDEFDALIQNTIVNSIENAADALGESIADFAASGKFDLPNLFGNLMSNLGAQIQQLGKFLITSSGLIKAAKEAFKTLLANPIASAVVGVGLIALGAILKAQAKKQYQGFASGTTGVGQGGYYEVGERGRERIFLPQGAKVQPNNEVNAFGGGGMVFIPNLTVQGTDLVIAFNRATQQMGRTN